MAMPNELYLDFESALKHLRSSDAVSHSAIAALTGADKRQVAAFAATWVELPVERRRKVSQILVELAEDSFELDYNLLFRYLLDDEDGQVRAHAIDGLWEDEDLALIKPLVGFLRSDPDAHVRAAAAESLGRFVLLAEYDRVKKDQADLIREALLATFQSGSESALVRARALESLAFWDSNTVQKIIRAAYAETDVEMRASAIAAMGHSADPQWAKIAAAELASPEPRLRFESARAVGELEFRESVPQLIKLLEDSDREVQAATITALGQIGGEVARKALERAADSEDEMLATLATDALDELIFTSDSDMLLLDMPSDSEKPRSNGKKAKRKHRT